MGKKIIILILFLSFSFFLYDSALADWWDRPDSRPTQPGVERFLPTVPPQPDSPSPTKKVTPTSPPNGGPEVTPTGVLNGDGGSTDDDPCAPGKAYSGEYCGWSPRIGEAGGGTEGETSVSSWGGPAVSGLSETSGEEAGISDIMLLAGILCLMLYAKSKLNPDIERKLIGKKSRP